MVTEITMENIKDIMDTHDGVMRFIMFYGTTCGPCKNTMPGYEYAAQYYTERKTPHLFYKINAWEPEEQKQFLNETFGPVGVPHFKVVLFGEKIMERSGGMDLARMFQFTQNCMDAAAAKFPAKPTEAK